MDRATRAVRRSASKLICSDESQLELNIALQEFRLIKDAVKNVAEVQRNASEFLLKWSLHEDNRAIKDVALQFNELTSLWSDAQMDFATRISDMVDQMENIMQTDKAVKERERQVTTLVEKEGKLSKEVKKAMKWRKGGDIRLLELKLNETIEARQAAERSVDESKSEQEAVKMLRFKSAMVKLAEAYLNMATSCGIIFEAQHDIARRMPEPSVQSVREMQYSGTQYTRERVEMARLRLSSLELTSNGSVRNHRAQRRSDPGRFPSCRLMEPPPPYCQFDPNQTPTTSSQ